MITMDPKLADSALGLLVQRLGATIPHSSQCSYVTDAPSIIYDLVSEVGASQYALDLLLLTVIVVLALELLSNLVLFIPKSLAAKNVPVRGKHLDQFSWKDLIFVSFSKLLTGLFVYCYFGYLWSVRKGVGEHGHDEHTHHNEYHSHGEQHHNDEHESHHMHHSHLFEHHCCKSGSGIWNLEELSMSNTLLPIPFLFIVYDFFYTLLHWFLHIKAIYAYVHKHHHHQKAPSRANIDAVNVHPLEFFLGEFNHVLALHIVVKGIPMLGFNGLDVSWLGALLFIGIGGILAGLNHTRHDVVIRLPSMYGKLSSVGSTPDEQPIIQGFTLFDSKHHDVHHRIPQSNYGQYTVFWDRIFGTFREYNESDRINPAYQLDPATGKTIKKE